jgi:hypothetical protein
VRLRAGAVRDVRAHAGGPGAGDPVVRPSETLTLTESVRVCGGESKTETERERERWRLYSESLQNEKENHVLWVLGMY